jgi:hypothetical protein
MKTEIVFFELNRHKRAIRQYAEVIAALAPRSSHAYVMAIDKNNEPLWVVQAGDQHAAMAISWKGVRMVVAQSLDKEHVYIRVYLASQKQMAEYMRECVKARRNGAEFIIAENNTQNNTQYHVSDGKI